MMTDAVYARSVQRNLATLMTYADTLDDFPKRHQPDLRDALREALSLAASRRMSRLHVLLITIVGVFRPVLAIRQVQRFLEDSVA